MKKIALFFILLTAISLIFGLYWGIKNWQANKKMNTYTETPERSASDQLMAGGPIITENFHIEYSMDEHAFVITPVMIFDQNISYTKQMEERWNEYEKKCLDAINWLKRNNYNPQELNISFWGKEWWPAGKIISY